jgi:hypothetical protein
MTTWLELDNGDLVPITAISSLIVKHRKDGLRTYDVRGLDEARLGTASENAVEATYPVIPAAPGWKLAYIDGPDADEFVLEFESIVAWRMLYAESPTPITVESMFGSRYVILSPSGEVTEQEIGRWSSVESAEAFLRAQWEGERARARAKAVAEAEAAIEEGPAVPLDQVLADIEGRH